MLQDIRTSQLINVKENLEKSLDVIKSSLAVRASLIDLKSQSAVVNAQIDAKNDPEHYYSFKIFDRAISIIYWNINDGYGLCYHIKCYNCRISMFDNGMYKQNWDISNHCYGHYNALDVAIVWYKRAVLTYLAQLDNAVIQYPLEIF